jgi:hypothetical protein
MVLKDTQNNMQWYLDNYIFLASYKAKKKIILKDSIQRCRFCGKTNPEVSFKDNAHVIPESIGNTTLFSTYECDSCNHFFGETIEDHLSKYLLPYKICSTISGKKNKLSYESIKKNRIDVTDYNIDVIESDNGALIEWIDNKRFKLKMIRQTYIPIMVFKSLVKMALSIVPESELDDLNNTFLWLKNKESCIEDNFGKYVVYRFITGKRIQRNIQVTICKRRNDLKILPMYIFNICFSNYNFQIIVPCLKYDKMLDGVSLNMPYLPTVYDFYFEQFHISNDIIDLSGSEKIKNQQVNILMELNRDT